MGTRNITRVVSDGQLKVCQYCQWDGYPTGAGESIINFIRTTDDEKMAMALRNVTLAKVVSDNATVFYTGAPASDRLHKVTNSEYDFRSKADREIHGKYGSNLPDDWYERMKKRTYELLVDEYGMDLINEWRMAIRDTGCDVLPIIYDTQRDLTTWTSDYLLGNYGDWQIQAVWELDYDTKVLTGWWMDAKRSWTFDELRGMTNDAVNREMESFENEGGED